LFSEVLGWAMSSTNLKNNWLQVDCIPFFLPKNSAKELKEIQSNAVSREHVVLHL